VGVTLRLPLPPVDLAQMRSTGRGGLTRRLHTPPHATPSADAWGTGAHAQRAVGRLSASRSRLCPSRTRAAGRRAVIPRASSRSRLWTSRPRAQGAVRGRYHAPGADLARKPGAPYARKHVVTIRRLLTPRLRQETQVSGREARLSEGLRNFNRGNADELF